MGVTLTWYWAVAAALGFFVWGGLMYLPMLISGETETRDRILLGSMLIWCVIIAPIYLIFFGRFVYQTIPDVWGGG